MNILLKAIVVVLPVVFLAACAKQETASEVTPADNTTSETLATSDADEAGDQEFSGELAAPADEQDFPDQPAESHSADEYAAAPSGNLPADGAAGLNQAAQEPAQLPAGPAAASQATPDAPSATATPTPPRRATIDESKILAEKHGQWANTAKASSTYASDPGPRAPYSAWQATGAPNVPTYSDHPSSWASKAGDAPIADWLELGFATAVRGTSIRIRQTAAPGVISKIELIDESGGTHGVWEGTDTTPYEKNTIGWFVADFPQTGYKVKGARITLATSRVWGWNEIDAVQLVGQK